MLSCFLTMRPIVLTLPCRYPTETYLLGGWSWPAGKQMYAVYIFHTQVEPNSRMK